MAQLRLLIENIDFEIKCEWNHCEFPQVGDSISVLHLCTEEQIKEFEKMDVPPFENEEENRFSERYKNLADYLDDGGFEVTSRSWANTFTIYCFRPIE